MARPRAGSSSQEQAPDTVTPKTQKTELSQDPQPGVRRPDRGNQTLDWGAGSGPVSTRVRTMAREARAMERGATEDQAESIDDGAKEQARAMEDRATEDQAKAIECGREDQAKAINGGAVEQTKAIKYEATQDRTEALEDEAKDNQTEAIKNTGPSEGTVCKTVDKGDSQGRAMETSTTERRAKTVERGTTDLQTETVAHRTTDLQTKQAVEGGATDLQTKEMEFSTTDQQTEAKGGIAGTRTEGSKREEKPSEPHNTPYRREVPTAGTQTEREEEGKTAALGSIPPLRVEVSTAGTQTEREEEGKTAALGSIPPLRVEVSTAGTQTEREEEGKTAALGSIPPLRVEVSTAGTQTEAEESGLGNSATVSKEVRTAETQTDWRLGETERPGEGGRTEGHQLVAQAFPWEANPAEIAERIMRKRSRVSVAFDDTEYEPYGLPEVVMRGFADIPSGPACPYVLRRGLLGTALQTGKPRAASEETPGDPTD
ncbi:CENPF protein, partial [Polyodon spathula]|nr:CENPF protein [Polyodon spathula]